MIGRPPRSTHCISSAASDVYKRQCIYKVIIVDLVYFTEELYLFIKKRIPSIYLNPYTLSTHCKNWGKIYKTKRKSKHYRFYRATMSERHNMMLNSSSKFHWSSNKSPNMDKSLFYVIANSRSCEKSNNIKPKHYSWDNRIFIIRFYLPWKKNGVKGTLNVTQKIVNVFIKILKFEYFISLPGLFL